MARCTNCKAKWKAKHIWSLFYKREGMDCPYCHQRQYFSADTFRFMSSSLLSILFLLLFPFTAELSDKEDLIKKF